MTTPSSPPPLTLVERVAMAMYDAAPRLVSWNESDCRDLYRDEAQAAIRVVVEECARLCDREHQENLDLMEGAGSPDFELYSGAESAADRLAHLIRRLSPQEPKP